ncbi:MAG TPA: hypothetical protein VFP68_03370 [Burkholderiaceae bacterium]|nr:hypothetical protein [Burkholderiaceae bacterium]
MGADLKLTPSGAVESTEGWTVRQLGPELIEYCDGAIACLVNVGYSPERRARAIFASESTSALAPRLREHLQRAVGLLNGRFVVI